MSRVALETSMPTVFMVYFPLVEKGNYFAKEMQGMIGKFFNNSVTQFASFFTANSKLSEKELIEIKKIIEAEIQKKKD